MEEQRFGARVGKQDVRVPEPHPDCPLCPRLLSLRRTLRTEQPAWHNAPVPTFGRDDAPLLIVGLAPGLKGANRTGRPFTGDFAGDLLYETLIAFGFAAGTYGASAQDGLRLEACTITNAVRCVPPQNKPLPAEIAACRPFLAATIKSMARLKIIIVLGRVAHESVLRALGRKPAAFPFAHGAQHVLDASEPAGSNQPDDTRQLLIFDSYHCSRYNTSTGVLTKEMFRAIFAKARASLPPS